VRTKGYVMFQIVRDLADALRDVQNSSARLLSVTDSSARRRASKIRRSRSSSSVRASTKARRRLSRLLALEQRLLGTGRVVDQPMRHSSPPYAGMDICYFNKLCVA
jgi:hypothetical protein